MGFLLRNLVVCWTDRMFRVSEKVEEKKRVLGKLVVVQRILLIFRDKVEFERKKKIDCEDDV